MTIYPTKALLTLADAISGFHNRNMAFALLKEKYDPELYCIADAITNYNNKDKARQWLEKNNYPEFLLLVDAIMNPGHNTEFVSQLTEDGYEELALMAEMITGDSMGKQQAAKALNQGDTLPLYHLASAICGFPDREASVKWLFDND